MADDFPCQTRHIDNQKGYCEISRNFVNNPGDTLKTLNFLRMLLMFGTAISTNTSPFLTLFARKEVREQVLWQIVWNSVEKLIVKILAEEYRRALVDRFEFTMYIVWFGENLWKKTIPHLFEEKKSSPTCFFPIKSLHPRYFSKNLFYEKPIEVHTLML